jgi:ribose 1,5-bisphosphate isomerase
MDWEHIDYKWIKPYELEKFPTVPKLIDTLKRVIKKPGEPIKKMSIHKRIESIKTDRQKGASQLAREGLEVMKLAAKEYSEEMTGNADYQEYLKNVGKQVEEARPSMAALSNAISYLLYGVIETTKKKNLSYLRAFTIRKVEELIHQSQIASESTAMNASKLISDGSRVMTHSYSSTVLGVFQQIFQEGKRVKAVVSESRPLFEGVATARALSKMNVPTTLIIDSAVGSYIDQIDLVLVGADSILADGSVVNKIGTLMMALSAWERNVPFFVVCEKWKFNVWNLLVGDRAVVLEESDSSEVLIAENISGLAIKNLYFDITPAKYISNIIFEEGIIRPNQIQEHMKKMLVNMYFG